MPQIKNILSVLKLASKFLEKDNARVATQAVICDTSMPEKTIFYACSGHTAVKITLEMDLAGATFLFPYLNKSSIENAVKCTDLSMLQPDNSFTSQHAETVTRLINNAIESPLGASDFTVRSSYLALCKDIGNLTKTEHVKIESHGEKEAIILISQSELILVQAVIMPICR